MPIRTTPPTIQAKAATDKIQRKLDREHTFAMFQGVLGVILMVHFLVVTLVTRGGIAGYFLSWKNFGLFFLAHPAAVPVVPVALVLLWKGIDLYKHADDGARILPAPPLVPDLRFEDSIYIGTGLTRSGKQEGEVVEEGDELLLDTPHVILKEKGLFGNIHVKGGVGGGKTSTLILPFINQAIMKYPRPPHPDGFPLGPDGRYTLAAGTSRPSRRITRITGRLGLGRPASAPTDTIETWNPYVGKTREEALALYDELLDLHQRRKWGLFVIDPKGDMTEAIQRMAKLANREDDVIVLRPDGPFTYNPLLINANPLVQAEMVMDGIEAVSGQAIQQYWRSTMSEWLANALTILRVVDPTRVTFKSILRMARSENLRSAMVAEAEAIMRQAQEEEERLRRLGKTYTGVRVNPAAIEFFRDWDDVDSDPSRKQAVVSGIKSQAKFFVDDELAPFLCPEMPPTFGGFEEMIDKGQIVILRMPLDQYGPVAKVLGILVLIDAQQAARARINKPQMNQERVVAFVIDEVQNYLNRLTKEFVSMNRQSRVCFLAAHQSQDQLVQHGDRGFEGAFKDNLRTKISYSSPNAEAARRESAIMGSRIVYRETWSEMQHFSRVERAPDSETFKPVGGESQGATVRIDEVERAWFSPEHFMELKLGECIVMEFDGERTLHPRKVKAQAYHESETFARAAAVPIDLTVRRPHPVVFVGRNPESHDHEYLNSAFSQTGYILAQPLANGRGELAGFKFITDVGTLIVSTDLLSDLQDTLSERLTNPQTLVVFTDIVFCSLFFAGNLGLVFERVLDLPDAYRRVFPDAGLRPFEQIFSQEVGRPLAHPALGAWEYHADVSTNLQAVLQDSRDTTALFSKLGDALHQLPDSELEALYEETRGRINEILLNPPPAPAPTDGPGTDGPVTANGDLGPEGDAGPAEPQGPPDVSASDAPAIPSEPLSDADILFDELDDPFSQTVYPDDALLSGEEPPEGAHADAGSALEPGPSAAVPSSSRQPLGTSDVAGPSPVAAAPQRRRRSRRRPAQPSRTLFDFMRRSPLAETAPDEDLDEENAAGPEGALPLVEDTRVPSAFPAHGPALPAARPASGAPADSSSPQTRRQTRRRHARSTGSAPSAQPPAPALDLGLPENSPPSRRTRRKKSNQTDDSPDFVSGAPVD